MIKMNELRGGESESIVVIVRCNRIIETATNRY